MGARITLDHHARTQAKMIRVRKILRAMESARAPYSLIDWLLLSGDRERQLLAEAIEPLLAEAEARP